MALAITAATLFRSIDDILGGLVGMVIWGYWSLSATNVEIVRDGHDVIVESYPALALFGGGIAALNLLIMLVGSGRMLDVRDADYFGEQQGQRQP